MAAVGVAAIAILAAGCDGRPRSIAAEVGQTIGGRLEQGDWTDVFADGSYTDLYHVRLGAGEQITVDLRSSDFDTYLSLMRGPGDQLVDNDDLTEGGSDTNSRLSYRAEATGLYYIAVTTFRHGATGAYTLAIRRSEPGTPVTAPGPSEPSKRTPEKTATPR
jgi:hypothetical protein